MMIKPFANPVMLLASALLSLAFVAPAQAQALTALHAKVKIGNKLCFVSHEHTGYARLRGSKKATARAAIRDWSSFTKLEYGARWARFGRAEARRVACRNHGSSYSCKVVARPCR